MPNIKNYAKTVICTMSDYDFVTCKKHRRDLLNEIRDLSCRFFRNNWCRDVSKILKGSRVDFDEEDDVQKIARTNL